MEGRRIGSAATTARSSRPTRSGRVLEASGSGALYVAPASPWQNGYAESFHSKLRDEFLDREEFESQPQAQAMGLLWKEEYNTERSPQFSGIQDPGRVRGHMQEVRAHRRNSQRAPR